MLVNGKKNLYFFLPDWGNCQVASRKWNQTSYPRMHHKLQTWTPWTTVLTHYVQSYIHVHQIIDLSHTRTQLPPHLYAHAPKSIYWRCFHNWHTKPFWMLFIAYLECDLFFFCLDLWYPDCWSPEFTCTAVFIFCGYFLFVFVCLF